MRRELVTKSTSGGCGQFETSPEAIEPEIRTALCERRQTDRLKTNYKIDEDDLEAFSFPTWPMGKNNELWFFDIIYCLVKLAQKERCHEHFFFSRVECLKAWLIS